MPVKNSHLMRSLVRNYSIMLLALFCAVLLAAADATVEKMLASGSIDEVIRTLANRNDAASLNLLSRAYYAIEHWDDAVKNGERAVSASPGQRHVPPVAGT